MDFIVLVIFGCLISVTTSLTFHRSAAHPKEAAAEIAESSPVRRRGAERIVPNTLSSERWKIFPFDLLNRNPVLTTKTILMVQRAVGDSNHPASLSESFL